MRKYDNHYQERIHLEDVIKVSQEQMRIYGTQTKTHFVAEYAYMAAKARLDEILNLPKVEIVSVTVDLCKVCGVNCTPDPLDIPCFLRSAK